LQFVLSKEGAECFQSSRIADLTDTDANNKIGVSSYSKQSYGSTVSDKKNSSGNGFRFPDEHYQGSSNYGQNRRSQSERNSPVTMSNENQHQKQVGWIKPKNTRTTESSTPRGFGNVYTRAIDDVKRCHHCNSDQHLIRDCEQAKRNQNTQGTRPMFQKSRVNQIQVMPTEEVNEEIENKVVMKCGVNLKPNYHEITTEQMTFKQAIKKDDSNDLKKIQLKYEENSVEIRGKFSGNTRKRD